MGWFLLSQFEGMESKGVLGSKTSFKTNINLTLDVHRVLITVGFVVKMTS